MTGIPPLTNPRAYATHLLAAWLRQLLQAEAGRPSPLLPVLKTELARRKAAAIPDTK